MAGSTRYTVILDAIVTINLKDFQEEMLAQHGVEAQHPDDFVMNHFGVRGSSLNATLIRLPMDCHGHRSRDFAWTTTAVALTP